MPFQFQASDDYLAEVKYPYMYIARNNQKLHQTIYYGGRAQVL